MTVSPVRLARWIFGAAGAYGLLVLTPFLFAEPMLARPGVGLSHPVYFYGFLGAALVMQFVYLTIARDPARFLPLMPIAALAKLAWFVPVAVLWSRERTDGVTLAFASMDLLIGVSFAFAWLRMGKNA